VIADDSIKENYFLLSNAVLIRNYPIIKYLEINLKNQETEVNRANTKFMYHMWEVFKRFEER